MPGGFGEYTICDFKRNIQHYTRVLATVWTLCWKDVSQLQAPSIEDGCLNTTPRPGQEHPSDQSRPVHTAISAVAVEMMTAVHDFKRNPFC